MVRSYRQLPISLPVQADFAIEHQTYGALRQNPRIYAAAFFNPNRMRRIL
jgi:hypothetical protein